MAVSRRALAVGGLGAVTAVVFGASLALLVTSDDDPGEGTPAATTTTVATAEPGDPLPVAQAFLVAWSRQDWTALNALVTDLGAGAAHAGWWRGLEASDVTLEIGDVDVLGDGRAFVTFDVALVVADAGRWAYSSQLTLLWDGANWLVDWFPDVLHPLMAAGDRLEVRRVWPERAPIVGDGGVVLATTFPTVVAGVIPNRITSREQVGEAFAAYTGVEADDVYAALDAPNVQPDWFVPVTEIRREDYPDVRPQLYPVPGIAFRVNEGRAPIEPGLALHVLGTTGEITAELLDELGEPYRAGDVVGRTPSSLERTHERALAGSPATQIVKVGGGGTTELLETFPGDPPVSLATTLSLEAQRAAEAALAGVETPAALVAIDIPTGGILAVASRPLEGFNRAVTGRYPPGSTFKLVVTLAALESGLERGSRVSCPDETVVGGRSFGNAVKLPETLTLEEALVRSCNTAFIELAGALGADAVRAAADKLGFDVDYTIGLATPGGTYPMPESAAEAAAAAIGQAKVLATPVHMASVAAAVVGGAWRPPTLLSGELGEPLEAIDPAVAATMRELMVRVVADRDGTGTAARVDGREVGGKTGTAQLGSAEDDPLVAWFVGFSEDIAFAVMVEQGESGGRTAAPVAAAFLEFLDRAPATAAVAACTDPAGGWLTFQGNNERTGCVTGVEPITEPVVAWQADVGAQAWLNNPVVVDDLVVVGTAGTARGRADSGDGVVAVRLSDGQLEWRFDAAVDVNGVAGADGVIVATGDEGKVWGLRARDGELLWEHDAGILVFTNPLIVDGLVVVGDAGGSLRGLGLADGEPAWPEVRLDGPIRGGAASDGRLVYAASDTGDVVAVDTAGEIIWRRLIEPSSPDAGPVQVLAAPTLVGEAVVISVIEQGTFTGPGLVALDRYVGTPRWRAADTTGSGVSNLTNSPSVARGLLVFAADLTTGIQAVDAASGAGVWQAETPTLCDRQWGSTLVVGETVVVARADGSLYAFDTATRAVAWEIALTAGEDEALVAECTRAELEVLAMEIQATPAVAPDGTLLVGSLGGKLYAVAQAAE